MRRAQGRRIRRTERRGGLTLAEVLICIFVLAVIAVPLFQLFSMSKKMDVAGRDLATAMNLASSMVASLQSLDKAGLVPVGPIEDGSLTGRLALSALGLDEPPEGYRREVTLVEVQDRPTPIYHVVVAVTWQSRVSRRQKSYALGRLLR